MAYLGALVALVFIGMISLGGLAEPKGRNELGKAGTWVLAIVSYGQVGLVCLLAHFS